MRVSVRLIYIYYIYILYLYKYIQDSTHAMHAKDDWMNDFGYTHNFAQRHPRRQPFHVLLQPGVYINTRNSYIYSFVIYIILSLLLYCLLYVYMSVCLSHVPALGGCPHGADQLLSTGLDITPTGLSPNGNNDHYCDGGIVIDRRHYCLLSVGGDDDGGDGDGGGVGDDDGGDSSDVGDDDGGDVGDDDVIYDSRIQWGVALVMAMGLCVCARVWW